MVNNILKVVFFLGAVVLAYLLYDSVASEMRYRAEVEEIEGQVISKLEKIREAELAYKDRYGKFTDNYDTLINFVKTGKMQITVEYGDKDDTTTVYRQEIVEVSILDSMFKNVNVDSLPFVPPHDTARFTLLATTIVQGNVEVPVFQVTDPYPFDKQRKNPNHSKEPLQVGSITEATYSGNWK